MMKYFLRDEAAEAVLMPELLSHVAVHRQKRLWSSEAGGLLFGTFEGEVAVVRLATGPRRTDRRSRHSYEPDLAAENREILKQHELGLHYVGMWHTHPERVPTPSCLDNATMQRCFSTATHELRGFLLLVVGTDNPPEGLHLSFVGRDSVRVMSLARSAALPARTAWGTDGLLARKTESAAPPFDP